MNIKNFTNLNPLLGNTLKLTGGSMVNYAIPIITTPILARLFTPAEYGDWGIFSSFVTIFTVFICGGFEFAIVESQSEKEKNNISQICLMICLVLNFLLLGVIGISEWFGINLFEVENTWLIPVYLFFAGLNAVLYNISNSRKFYKELALSQVFSGLVMAGSRIIFGLLHISNGLIYGAILSLFVIGIWLYRVTDFSKVLKERFCLNDAKAVFKNYKNYPLYDAPSTLIVYLSNNIPILILGAFYGKEYVGCYTMVLHLLLLPMAFIGSNMSKVFFQQISVPKCNRRLASRNVFKISFFLGLAVILFFSLGGDYILYLFLGSNWKIAGTYALYLALWSFTTIIFAPLKPIYRIKKKQNVQMRLVLASFVVQSGLLFFCSNRIEDIGLVVCLYSICCSLFKFIEGIYILWLCDNVKLLKSISYIVLSVSALTIWSARIINTLT